MSAHFTGKVDLTLVVSEIVVAHRDGRQ